MRIRILGPTLLLLAAVLPAADQLQLNGDMRVEGALLQWSASGCVLVGRDGRPATYRNAAIRHFEPGTSTAPRWARILTDGEEKVRMLKVIGFENGVLRYRDEKGEAGDLRPGGNEVIEFYRATGPQRQLKVPHVKQKPDYCGEACIEMITTYFGERVSQDRANELSGLGGRRGVYGHELVKVIDERLRLETAGRFRRGCVSAADHLWDRVCLVRALSLGRPVLLGVWGTPERKHNEDRWAFDHFVLLVGYDLEKGHFLINDPGSAERDKWVVSFQRFPAHRTNRSGGLFHIEFPPWRTWTRGEKRFRAEFIGASNGKVQLRGLDGREMPVPLKDLSETDRTVIERLKTE